MPGVAVELFAPLLQQVCVERLGRLQIAYATAGTRRPAQVFIRGGLANRTFWREQLDSLSRRHQVVAVDLAGHGASERRHADWTIPGFGEDVHVVVDQLQRCTVARARAGATRIPAMPPISRSTRTDAGSRPSS